MPDRIASAVLEPSADAGERAGPREIVSIGYLRAFLVLLVLAHHAVLAYHSSAPPQASSLAGASRWWQAFPVVDAQRSDLVALFVAWNDAFFMALLFLLSGLFVSGSLARKGASAFLRDRLRRLGLPFLVLAAIIAPLAYYPAYLATAAPAGIAGFWREWLTLGNWPSGPGWFLWVLLVFDAAAVGLFALAPHWATGLATRLSNALASPVRCFVLLVATTALIYVPLALAVHPWHWTAVGPFFFQTSRLPHYAVYFVAGILIGACGVDRGLLAQAGRLARRWPVWIAVASVAFVFSVASGLAAMAPGAGVPVRAAANLGFVLSCAASSFALLAVFLRFARKSRPTFDSLRDNAYGMYVVHYPVASWLQFALLGVSLSAPGKAGVAIAATVLLSWALAAALRRVPAVRRVV